MKFLFGIVLALLLLCFSPQSYAQAPCWQDGRGWHCPWDWRFEHRRYHEEWIGRERHEERERAKREWCERHPYECR